jgi:hypothetical protein
MQQTVTAARCYGKERLLSISVFLRTTEMPYILVFTQFRAQNRCTLLLELL